jgi:hypothetical protein
MYDMPSSPSNVDGRLSHHYWQAHMPSVKSRLLQRLLAAWALLPPRDPGRPNLERLIRELEESIGRTG